MHYHLKRKGVKICLLFAKSVISSPHTEDLLPGFHSPIRLQLPWSASLAIPTYSPIHAVTERFCKSFILFILEHLNNNSWLCTCQIPLFFYCHFYFWFTAMFLKILLLSLLICPLSLMSFAFFNFFLILRV